MSNQYNQIKDILIKKGYNLGYNDDSDDTLTLFSNPHDNAFDIEIPNDYSPLHDELYRGLNGKELHDLLYDRLPIGRCSFTKNKDVTILETNENDYVITFDTDILFQNFSMIEIIYNEEFFRNNPEISCRIYSAKESYKLETIDYPTDLAKNNRFKYKGYDLFKIYLYSDEPLNYIYDDNYNKIGTERLVDELINYAWENEVLALDGYEYRKGLIKDIQCFSGWKSEELYDILKEIVNKWK
jgi:hypothetical protein